MRRSMALLACCALTTGPLAAQEAIYGFEWQGGGGYSMRGAFAIDEGLATGPRLDQEAVTCFEVTGFSGGQAIGRWALGQLQEDTTWVLTFDLESRALVPFGTGDPMPQAWNMDGFGRNCGEGGFGFNIGNAAQDICLNNELIVESQVPPPTPIPTRPLPAFEFSGDACRTVPLFSRGP
ncbi:MAG: hypothetical protein AAFN09_04060 [Pseudomonadota bacterium]